MTWAAVTTFGHPLFLLLVFAVNCVSETGLPIPLVMTGFMVATGYHLAQGEVLGATGVVAAAALGSLLGAMVLYLVAYWFGMPALQRFWRVLRLRESWLEQARARSERLSLVTITSGRIVPSLALPVNLAAGLGRVGLPTFVGAVFLSNAAWMAPLVVLGYLIGSTGMDLDRAVALVPTIIVVLAVLLLLAKFARPLWRRVHGRGAAQS